MDIFYGAYVFLTGLLFFCLFPFFLIYSLVTGKYSRHLLERLGFVPNLVIKGLFGSPRIWIHAVSLGEIKVAVSIIDAVRRIMPDCSIILSTTTEHGRMMAEEIFGDEVPLVYAPIDFIGAVRKAILAVRPDIMVYLETEIWPSWIYEAHRMGIKTALINGRVSTKTIGRYLKCRCFFSKVLANFDAFSMIMDEDAGRIKAMGADPHKIEVNGNAKYDALIHMADTALGMRIRNILRIDADTPAIVAGSTRKGEELMVLDAFREILRGSPDAVLILAPRHIERMPEIIAVMKNRGFEYQLWTSLKTGKERRTKQVVLINTFGELFSIYSVGTIVFCGGSLVPLGGQNPLEPAIWGKMVLYGPFMDNFMDAKALLEKFGAGVSVDNSRILADKAIWLLHHPEELAQSGRRAREAVLHNEQAAEKHAQVIRRLVEEHDKK